MTVVLPILYQDERFVIINKPSGLIVHRTKISDDTVFAVQLLRDQLGKRVWPVHRLDRATSGCLLFAFSPAWTAVLQTALANSQKHYLALVRGRPKTDTFTVDTPLSGKEACTQFSVIKRVKDPRSSLLWARPTTGRSHQIRRHLNQAAHPVLLDSRHGDTRINKLWRDEHGLHRLALHAHTMRLNLPNDEVITATAPLPPCLADPMTALGYPTTFLCPRE